MNVADIASGNNSISLINKVDDVVLGSFFGQSRPDLLAGYLYHVGPREYAISRHAHHTIMKSYHTANSNGCSSLDQ
ncbi:uncharacterized protein Bfra_008779 [Botrytis fragariae]|uniref:Uncharacterized protein n=1 Tax=Botrytis fragariae TaxID=1964551 RepID=A0A8H6EH62_9HELO|nr:uncharacterized protein Bfra_008779 [Botrytis fragariae]KAF5871755.1 hypothetical protein Bfra_008779 [Botrytis fragariae]